MPPASSLSQLYDVRQNGKFLGSYGLYSLKNRFLQGHLDPEVEIAPKGTEAWQPAWQVIPEARSVRGQRRAFAAAIPEESRVFLSRKEVPWEVFQRRLTSGLVLILGPVASLAVLGSLVFGVTLLVGKLSVGKGSAEQALQAACQGDTKELYHLLHGSLFTAGVELGAPLGPDRPDLFMAYLLEAGARADHDVAKVMLEAGARVDTTWKGQSPMSLALKQLPEDRGRLLMLMIEHGAEADREFETTTPLLEAVRLSPQDGGALVEKLLQAGADPAFAPPSDPARTPLAMAGEVLPQDGGKALGLLLQGGAKIPDSLWHEALAEALLLQTGDGGILFKQAMAAGLRVPEAFWRPEVAPQTAEALARLFPELTARHRAAVSPDRKP